MTCVCIKKKELLTYFGTASEEICHDITDLAIVTMVDAGALDIKIP